MHICLIILLSTVIVGLLSSALLAVFPLIFKIKIIEMSLGFGKQIFTFGTVKMKAIPFGGYVKLFNTEEHVDMQFDVSTALNVQPIYKQFLIAIGSPLIQVGISIAILGWDGVEYFVNGFYQIISGAISPTVTAQSYLSTIPTYVENNSFVHLLALIMTKNAAINLLPLLPMNGGQAIQILLGANGKESLISRLTYISLLVLFYIAGVWIFALAWFCLG